MADTPADRGATLAQRLTGGGASEFITAFDGLADDLGRYIVEFVFGEIYARPGLDVVQRQCTTIAALTSIGHAEPQLKLHVSGALRIGVDKAVIVETIVQCLPYAGFPRTINALHAARAAMEEMSAQDNAVNRLGHAENDDPSGTRSRTD